MLINFRFICIQGDIPFASLRRNEGKTIYYIICVVRDSYVVASTFERVNQFAGRMTFDPCALERASKNAKVGKWNLSVVTETNGRKDSALSE